MAIQITRKTPATPRHIPFNTKETRQLFMSDAHKLGSSLGGAFYQDWEIERCYHVWKEAGNPASVWVGYTIVNSIRTIEIVQKA